MHLNLGQSEIDISQGKLVADKKFSLIKMAIHGLDILLEIPLNSIVEVYITGGVSEGEGLDGVHKRKCLGPQVHEPLLNLSVGDGIRAQKLLVTLHYNNLCNGCRVANQLSVDF